MGSARLLGMHGWVLRISHVAREEAWGVSIGGEVRPRRVWQRCARTAVGELIGHAAASAGQRCQTFDKFEGWR